MSINLRSDIKVNLVQHVGNDESIARAAWISTENEPKLHDEGRIPGLVNYLMAHRHGCYDDQTEVLTEDGWVAFPDFVGNPKRVWTLNLSTGLQELQNPLRVVDEPFSGQTVRILNQGVDLMVTPNHRMVAQRRISKGWGGLTTVSAEDFFDRAHRVYLSGGERPASTASPLSPDEEEILGFVIADGNVNGSTVEFHLRKPRKIAWLKERAEVSEHPDGRFRLVTPSPSFVELARGTYYGKDRVIPSVALSWGVDSAQRILRGYLEGDGYTRFDGKTTASTVSRLLVDGLFELALIAGVAVRELTADTQRRGAHGSRPLYRLAFLGRNSKPRVGWTLEDRHREVSYVPYEGRVYCATVPNGTLYVRRNGKSLWCGNSPFEHNSVTFRVEAPIMVFREWHRHRIQSYNEQSGRYTQFLPDFYVPPRTRQIANSGTSARPKFEGENDKDMYDEFYESLEEAYNHVWQVYEDNLARGVSNEMARLVLPVATYTSMYATANLRAWLHFISLRTSEPNAHWQGHPQWEIVEAARAVEEELTKLFPTALEAFNKNGRVAP